MKYEYQRKFVLYSDDVLKALNALGDEGWQVVSMNWVEDNSDRLVSQSGTSIYLMRGEDDKRLSMVERFAAKELAHPSALQRNDVQACAALGDGLYEVRDDCGSIRQGTVSEIVAWLDAGLDTHYR